MNNEKVTITLASPDLGYNISMRLEKDIVNTLVCNFTQELAKQLLLVNKEMTTEVHQSIITTATPDVIVSAEVINEAIVLPPGKRGYPFTHEMFKYSKVITYKCPHCGKVTFRRMTLLEENITHCHFCREEIEIKTVAKTEVACPHCEAEPYTAWVANGIDVISCKDCNAEIDIVYSNDKLTARTWNLEI